MEDAIWSEWVCVNLLEGVKERERRAYVDFMDSVYDIPLASSRSEASFR